MFGGGTRQPPLTQMKSLQSSAQLQYPPIQIALGSTGLTLEGISSIGSGGLLGTTSNFMPPALIGWAKASWMGPRVRTSTPGASASSPETLATGGGGGTCPKVKTAPQANIIKTPASPDVRKPIACMVVLRPAACETRDIPSGAGGNRSSDP